MHKPPLWGQGRFPDTLNFTCFGILLMFMAVTLHWIVRTKGGELELMTALGTFRYVNNQHSGRNIAQHLVKALEELNILNQIGGITLDNASNNDTAMVVIEDYFEECGLKYSGLQNCLHVHGFSLVWLPSTAPYIYDSCKIQQQIDTHLSFLMIYNCR